MRSNQHDLNICLDDAINRGKIEEVIELLGMGADIEYRDPFGRTPLMDAAWVASADIVKYLIEHGADLNAIDNEGKSALEIVREIGHNEYGHDDVIVVLETGIKTRK